MFSFSRLFLDANKSFVAAPVMGNLPAIELMEGRLLLSASPVHHHRHDDGPNHDLHDNHVIRVTAAEAGADDNAGHDLNDDKGHDRVDNDAHDKAEKRHGGQDDPKGHH